MSRDKDGSIRKAPLLAVIQQFRLLNFSALLLDGGRFFRCVLIATIGYWAAASLILARRLDRPTDSDIALLKWGIWPMLAIIECLGLAYVIFDRVL